MSGFDIFICFLAQIVPNLSAVSVFKWIQGHVAIPGAQDGLLGQVLVLAHFAICRHMIEGDDSGEKVFKIKSNF